MRTNAERQNYENYDVYSDLNTPYSTTTYSTDNQEFSLRDAQEKLGLISNTADNTKERVDVGTNADVMPSELTMTNKRYYEAGTTTSTSTKISTKTKVAVICYVAAVLVLVLGIALASVSVSSVFANTTKLTADYQSTLAEVDTLDSQLAVEDYAALAERAAELGYIDASQVNNNTSTYTQVETRPAQNFHIETNWFDSFCDWLCNVFGG